MKPGLRAAAFCFGLVVIAPGKALGDAAALVRFEVTGARDTDRQLERDVREALSRRLVLVPEERVEAAMAKDPALFHCAPGDGRCLARLGEKLEARFLVRGGVSYDGSDYQIALEVEDAAAGRALEPEKTSCVLCGWAELREKLGEAARAVGKRAAEQPPVARKATPSSGTGADTGAGVPLPHLRFLTVAKWVAGAIAVGLVATGAVMLAYDGQCSSALPATAPPGARCPRVYDTAVEGGVVLGVGGAFAAASAAFFLLDRKPASPSLTPAVTPTKDGATLSLTVRF